MLLPHTETKMGAITLELGVDSISAPEIVDRFVRGPASAAPQPGPVVMLLGCDTATERIPFSNVVAAFRRAHASVVLATLSTVRGRHMAPAAEKALGMLVARSKDSHISVGNFVVELRRTLLAHDLPIGLTFLAFGDIDWQIGGAA